MMAWTDVDAFLLDSADGDLRAGAAITPCLVAFRTEEPLLCAYLRSFDKGQYHDPMIELLALTGGLAADRLAVSFPGRAWSLDDPIPPVLDDGGDLRQHVLAMTFVDATVDPPTRSSSIVPYEPAGPATVWGSAVHSEAGDGWITQALTTAAQHRGELAARWSDIRAQAARCQRLGHVLGFGPATAAELGCASGQARKL